MKALALTLSVALIIVFRVTGQVEDFSTLNFRKADSVAHLYPNHSLENLQSLADKLTTPFTSDAEKFRALYTWVCLNIKSDHELVQTSKSKRKKLQHDPAALASWNQKFSVKVIKTLKKHHRTLCTGYAFLLQELSRKAGISCQIVNGYGRSAQSNIGGTGVPNHSWNIVKLNNKWYLCDPTWSSGAYDSRSNKFITNYNDIYFLLEPDLFVRNHYPLDTARMLLTNKPTLSEFLNSPLIYVDIFKHKVIPLMPDRFDITAARHERISFQLSATGHKSVEKIELQVNGPSSVYAVNPELVCQGKDISITHAFAGRGEYTIHMLLDGKQVVTWVVNVM